MTLRALSIAPRFRRAARFTLTYILLGASLLIAVPAPSAAARYHLGRHQKTSLLTVALSGSGTVTSSPAGIDCGTTCSARFTNGASVTLTAAAASGYSFFGWNGACSGTSTSCTVSMTAASSVTATFSQNVVNYTLGVSTFGSGTVTSSPGGINCGTSCSASYASGTSVTLTAAAASGYSFSGWIGACSGTSVSCTVSMNAARSVAATFSQNVALTAPDTTIQCSGSGLAATDLSDQCRSSTPTPGALEAIDPSTLPIP